MQVLNIFEVVYFSQERGLSHPGPEPLQQDTDQIDGFQNSNLPGQTLVFWGPTKVSPRSEMIDLVNDGFGVDDRIGGRPTFLSKKPGSS